MGYNVNILVCNDGYFLNFSFKHVKIPELVVYSQCSAHYCFFDVCSAQIMGTESVAYTHKNKGSCFLF